MAQAGDHRCGRRPNRDIQIARATLPSSKARDLVAPGLVIVPNPLPFHTIAIYFANLESPFWVRQFAGNLLLLLPVGLLGPIAFPVLNGWLRVFIAALALSVAIEFAQLWIPNRMADVDDVLLNVAGAMLGYAILSVARLGSGPRRAPAERD
jgi:glycopeptide antibiotics resistance protein